MIHALVGCALLLAAPVVDPNIYGLATFEDRIYAATLDEGLLRREGAAWKRIVPPLSDPRPRWMMPLVGDLWVQNAGGKLDRITSGGFIRLDQGPPQGRREVHCLATDGRVLLAGQWGGWSEFDGKRWHRFLDIPALQGFIVTAMAADERHVYLGTQGAGLGAYDRLKGTFRWIDRGLRLQDDWITCLALHDGDLFVGTFVGGLSQIHGSEVNHFSQTGGRQITCLVSHEGSLYVGTRFGLLKLAGEDLRSVPTTHPNVQALLGLENGLWVGTSKGASVIKLSGS